jgi:hypothetical protein
MCPKLVGDFIEYCRNIQDLISMPARSNEIDF